MLPQIKRPMRMDMSKVTQCLQSRLAVVIPVHGGWMRQGNIHISYISQSGLCTENLPSKSNSSYSFSGAGL